MSIARVHRVIFCVATAALLMLTSHAHAAGLEAFAGRTGNIDIAGGTAHIPVMKEAAKRIMQANPDVRITVAGGGSGVGVQKAGEGLAQIGNTGRALSKKEVAKYGLISFPFAVDGVATVINPANQIKNLTSQQVQDIFVGRVTNWREVGGKDATIHLYTRDEASGTRDVYWKKLLKKGFISAGANVVPSNGAMKTAIAQDPDAIGYVSVGHLDETVKAPDLDGQAVNQETAAGGQYPIVRKLYMNTKGEPKGVVKLFIDYVMGPEGAKIVTASGYIPVR